VTSDVPMALSPPSAATASAAVESDLRDMVSLR
jgi:hypothetical protein